MGDVISGEPRPEYARSVFGKIWLQYLICSAEITIEKR